MKFVDLEFSSLVCLLVIVDGRKYALDLILPEGARIQSWRPNVGILYYNIIYKISNNMNKLLNNIQKICIENTED